MKVLTILFLIVVVAFIVSIVYEIKHSPNDYL
jgi:hypothetical protein